MHLNAVKKKLLQHSVTAVKNMIVATKEKWFCFDGYTLGGVGV